MRLNGKGGKINQAFSFCSKKKSVSNEILDWFRAIKLYFVIETLHSDKFSHFISNRIDLRCIVASVSNNFRSKTMNRNLFSCSTGTNNIKSKQLCAHSGGTKGVSTDQTFRKLSFLAKKSPKCRISEASIIGTSVNYDTLCIVFHIEI